jgi:hypothetical protein
LPRCPAVAAVLMLALAPAAGAQETQGTPPDLFAPPYEHLYSTHASQAYSLHTAGEHIASIPWLTAGIFAGTLAIGVFDWDWGSAEFHFADEGFFGEDTFNGGMDKAGHAFGTYLLSDLFTAAIRRNAEDPRWASLTGAGLAMGVMTTVEILDGFSGHGFAWQDMVMNTIGASFSVLRDSVPGMREKVDFRMEYLPSGHDDDNFKPHSDYAGQKYVLAVTLAGFEGLEHSPLRFVELHTGYYARGFTGLEKDEGEEPHRELYVGVGLNMGELLFGWPSVRDTTVGRIGRGTLDYVQVPYTYAATSYD